MMLVFCLERQFYQKMQSGQNVAKFAEIPFMSVIKELQEVGTVPYENEDIISVINYLQV